MMIPDVSCPHVNFALQHELDQVRINRRHNVGVVIKLQDIFVPKCLQEAELVEQPPLPH